MIAKGVKPHLLEKKTAAAVPAASAVVQVELEAAVQVDQAAAVQVDQAAAVQVDQAAAVQVEQAAAVQVDQAAVVQVDQVAVVAANNLKQKTYKYRDIQEVENCKNRFFDDPRSSAQDVNSLRFKISI